MFTGVEAGEVYIIHTCVGLEWYSLQECITLYRAMCDVWHNFLRWWNELVHEQMKSSKKTQHVKLKAGHN